MTEIYNLNTKKDSDYGFSDPIKTDINKATIIPILADSIYKNPLSSIRELYFNEVTACTKSELKDQRILITFNSSTRELIITGENSTGISKDVFNSILTTMGNSGNTGIDAGTKSGLFGLGFFSHVKISEKAIIHTKTKDENYSFISKSGISFEFLPKEFEKILKHTGTQIILTIKDDVRQFELIDYISEIVELSPIKTEFYFDNDKQELKQYSSLKQLAKSQYSDYKNEAYPDYCYRIYQEINDVFELIIVKKYPNTHDNIQKTFLLHAPINLKIVDELDKISQKYFNQVDVYLKVKNERDFKPHVSRDFFESKIEEKIAKLVLSHFELFVDDNARIEIDSDNEGFKPLNIVKFLNDKNKFFINFYNRLECKVFESKFTKFTRHLDEISKNYSLENKIKHVCLVSTLDEIEINHLKNYGVLLIAVRKRDRSDFESYFTGLKSKKEIYKTLGIPKIKKDPVMKNEDLVFHSYYNRNDYSKSFTVKNPARHSKNFHNLVFVRENITGENIYKISDIPNLPEIKDLLFFTQDGYKTLKDLDSSYTFIQGEIFRKFKPDFEKFAYLPKYNNEKISDLLALYFKIDNDGSFCKNINPYQELIKHNKTFEKLIEQNIIATYHIDNFDDYALLINLTLEDLRN